MARSSDFRVNTTVYEYRRTDQRYTNTHTHTRANCYTHMLWLLDTLSSNRIENNENLDRSVTLATVFIQRNACTEGTSVLGRNEEWYCWHLPVGCCPEFKLLTPTTQQRYNGTVYKIKTFQCEKQFKSQESDSLFWMNIGLWLTEQPSNRPANCLLRR